MSADLRRAIANYLLRWWWAWAFVAVAQVLSSVQLLSGQAPNVLMAVVTANFGYMQFIGWQRVICTLPLSRKEVGQFRWWTTVGLPGALISVATLLPFLALPFIKTTPPLLPVLTTLVRVWGASGLMTLYYDLGNRFTQSNGSARVGIVLACALILGASLIAVGFPFVHLRTFTYVVSGIGVAVTAYGLARADRYVISRPVDRRGSIKDIVRFEKGDASGWLGVSPSGWFVVARRQATTLSAWIAVFGIYFIVELVLPKGAGRTSLPVLLAAIMGISQPMVWAPATRAFRALPMTAERLALALMSIMFAPWIVTAGILYGMGVYFRGSELLSSVVFLLSFTALALPLTLRLGQSQVVLALVIWGSALPVVIFAEMTRDIRSPIFIGIELGMAALFLAVSYAWTRYELTNGTHAYRPRQMQLTSFGGGMLPR